MISTIAVRVSILIALLAGATSAQSTQPLRYALPYKNGALELQLPGLQMREASMHPDGSGVRVLAQGPQGLVMTLFVQQAENPGGSTTCRQEWWSKTRKGIESKMKITSIRLYETGQTAIAEYMVPEYQGVPRQSEELACLFCGRRFVGRDPSFQNTVSFW